MTILLHCHQIQNGHETAGAKADNFQGTTVSSCHIEPRKLNANGVGVLSVVKEHFECGCKEGFECLLNEQFSTCEEEDNPEKTVEVVTKHLESQMSDLTGGGDKAAMKWNFASMGSLGVLLWDRPGKSHG